MQGVLFGVDLSSYISHYGVKEKSGRYPFGSGDDPYQRITRGSLSKKQKKQLISKARQRAAVEMRINHKPKTEKPEKPKKKVTDLTEEELRREIDKMMLQKRYMDLLKSMSPPEVEKTESIGKKIVTRFKEEIGPNTIANLSTGVLTYYGGKIINKAVGESVFDIKPMPLSSKKK